MKFSVYSKKEQPKRTMVVRKTSLKSDDKQRTNISKVERIHKPQWKVKGRYSLL